MHMKCNKFMLTDNTFDNLHDSSLGLTYGLLDVQGNTFEKLTGKPFVDMRPILELVSFIAFPSTVFSFLFAEIPYRKFMFFYSLRNEFLRSENEFHRFLFSKKMNLPEKTVKFSKNG